MSRPPIIDVVFDMETQDPDDYLCLIFLASHPRINLKAVTITPGSRDQVGIVRWALGKLGLDNLPVGAGNINHPKASVSPWHGRAYFADKSLPSSSDAEEAWRVLMRECDKRTVLFTGGPLTNLARAIEEGGADGFVAGCWLGQGGFAGDNIVPQEHRLSKFVGRTHMQTFNFQSNLPAARACLAHGGFGRIRLVSKNVCHAESNRFGPDQLARLEARLAATAPSGHAVSRHCDETSTRHHAGLELLAIGMRAYMQRHPMGKLLHDPLAAACILNSRIVEWREVAMSEDLLHAWGCSPRDGSGTFISVRHAPEAFWAALLDDAPMTRGGGAVEQAPGRRADGALLFTKRHAQSVLKSLPKGWKKCGVPVETVEGDLLAVALSPVGARIFVDVENAPKSNVPPLIAALIASGEVRWVAGMRFGGAGSSNLDPSPSTRATETDCAAAAIEEEGMPELSEPSTEPGREPVSDAWACDWDGIDLPPYVQPARPKGSEGGDALEKLAAEPTARPERVLLATTHCVVVYDIFPKARVHVLILPREPIAKPQELAANHTPLLRHMLQLAEWLAPRLRAQHAGLPPLRCGFHAVPSMRQMHLHLISLDMDSPELKRPRHWIIFNTDYLVAPMRWVEMLEEHGRVHVERAAEEAKLKMPMVCPLTGVALAGMDAVKEHVRSSAYQDAVSDAGAHMVFL